MPKASSRTDERIDESAISAEMLEAKTNRDIVSVLELHELWYKW